MAKTKNTEIFEKKLLEFIGEPDPLYCLLQWLLDKMMEIEAANKAGAEKRSHSASRATHFSGYRPRRFDTRLGTMYLLVPKLRKGGYIPFFVTEKKRSEQALIQVVQEAFINGVSTRKIEKLAQSLGIENISASQVSEINKGLDEQVEAFKNRPLDSEYPVIWVDALYEKIRYGGRVQNMAVLVVSGINSEGYKEILAVEPMTEESESTYRELFQSMKARGYRNSWLCVSDAHMGLQAAVRKELIGCSWQRCKVHFMRNILSYIPAKEKLLVAGKIKQIWNQPDAETARSYALKIIVEYQEKYPKAMDCLENGLEDSIQFYAISEIDKRKISSTNLLERLNKEIRRRSRVVGIFPSIDSYQRLICCYLIEYSEDWSTGKKYISKSSLEEQRIKLKEVA